MGLGKVLLGESYTPLTGRVENVDLEPTEIGSSQEAIARAKMVERFVANLPKPDVRYNGYWSEEVFFRIPGSDVETLNSSVFWLTTNLGGCNAFNRDRPIVTEYPYYTVGVNLDSDPQLVLMAAQMGSANPDMESPALNESLLILNLKPRVLKYIEQKLKDSAPIYGRLDTAKQYDYTHNFFGRDAFVTLGLTDHYYHRMQAKHGFSGSEWQKFHVLSCLENLATNFGKEQELLEMWN